eukprot:4283453-Prymnesium_polylepis.1
MHRSIERRVRRGRPITIWRSNPNEKKKSISKTPRPTSDIDAIIATVVELSNSTAPNVKLVSNEANQFPYIAASARTEKAENEESLKLQNEKASVRNEEDDESRMKMYEAAYAQSVHDTVFAGCVKK